MRANEVAGRADKPLLGAVICCTSVPQELRAQYAEYAIQMGAEHKLDLTSDVTHLLVGDTNTEKYQYVAKERIDVKVLRPEWVEAARLCWMNDEDINFNALEAQYTLPVFAGLKICITGFEDLRFRGQIQEEVTRNGGEYSGDLTKDVTHLIAAVPEGKKYLYATQWQKKVVGLKWFRDSLDRKMQLDESLYHPTISPEDQGRGAWNRIPRSAHHLGKRSKDDQKGVEPPRKLRRTASAKFSSQNDTMWGDIVAGAALDICIDGETLQDVPEALPSDGHERHVPVSFMVEETIHVDSDQKPTINQKPRGFYAGKCFHIHGFDARKAAVLHEIILNSDGVIAESLDQFRQLATQPSLEQILLVSFLSSKATLPNLEEFASSIQLASELWVEYCLSRKAFVSPTQYPLGTILDSPPVDGFASLAVSSTGFQGIELLHLSKMVTLMGARYEEVFKPSASVLICNGTDASSEKIRHAQAWNVPAVSQTWLWSCIKTGQFRPPNEYILNKETTKTPEDSTAAKKTGSPLGPQAVVRKPEVRRQESFGGNNGLRVQKARTIPSEDTSEKKRGDSPSQNQKPGSDFFEQKSPNKPQEGRHPSKSRTEKKVTGELSRAGKVSDEVPDAGGLPLKEISTNSPPRGRSPSRAQKKPLFRKLESGFSMPEDKEPPLGNAIVDNPEPVGKEHTSESTRSINGDIQDLLSMKARTKSAMSTGSEVSSRKKGVVGRALSNLSNSSIGSNVRASRASSVDSMNTDGIGSEIAPEPDTLTTGIRSNFTGRAKARDPFANGPSIGLDGNRSYGNEYDEDETMAPQLTQLGYEDPEEVILLREKLAERRRSKSRIGQEDDTRKRPPQKQEERRLQDDDALTGGVGGWGAGRRTRHKDKNPSAIERF